MLEKPVQSIRGVGSKRSKILERIGLTTIGDMLFYFPKRYDDWSQIRKLAHLTDGNKEVAIGYVVRHEEIKHRRGLYISKAVITDGATEVYGVWFNQKHILKNIPKGTYLALFGKVERKYNQIQIISPEYEVFQSPNEIQSKILPVYGLTNGLTQKVIRGVITEVLERSLDKIGDYLPDFIKMKYGFLELKTALKNIHFPASQDLLEKSRKRLIFDEFFLLQITLLQLKKKRCQKKGISFGEGKKLTSDFFEWLPFKLTEAQERVWHEVETDMEATNPMNRLIQGDVGSGKTIIAAAAMLKAYGCGYQSAMMVPTEILAEQHFQTLNNLYAGFGIKTVLFTGKMNAKERGNLIEAIASGEAAVVIGTHAIIQKDVRFKKLGLVITDEQHRFGVKQRKEFEIKGFNPDTLVMTATPIPRTLAHAIYGDLDISIIDQMPEGRKEVKTYLVSPGMRHRVYNFIREQVKLGRQVYYICPLVEGTESLQAASAVELYKSIQNKFPDVSTGLVHGQLSSAAKDTVMDQFRKGTISILVATTVIEVGVNVPNATVIVIENAERFGIAQLHQLRGRVGRSNLQSYCILIANPKTEIAKERLKALVNINDGFLLAEKDFQLRGPGELLGLRQHGLPDFKIGNLVYDGEIMRLAREEAQNIVEVKGIESFPLLFSKYKEFCEQLETISAK
jgi:ATP-dependent DNA helicase RecG